tara:strand:- start:2074 stop:2205 length:132 start_codon:yes stop_codon:yes gene_type:complete
MLILIPFGLMLAWAAYEISRGQDIFNVGEGRTPTDYDFGKYDD